MRNALEAQAKASGIGLATLLRNRATKAADEAKRARIRSESARIGTLVATSAEARAFYGEIGTPTTDAG